MVEQDAFVVSELAERPRVLDNKGVALEPNSMTLLKDAEFKKMGPSLVNFKKS